MPARDRTTTTPPKVAEEWGIGVNKVLAFIRSGELRAFNVATCSKGRPRWIIELEELERFKRARSSTPAPKSLPRRQKPAGIKDFF
jgi:hypothetical protein